VSYWYLVCPASLYYFVFYYFVCLMHTTRENFLLGYVLKYLLYYGRRYKKLKVYLHWFTHSVSGTHRRQWVQNFAIKPQQQDTRQITVLFFFQKSPIKCDSEGRNQGSAIPTFFSISHREMGNTGIPGNSWTCKSGSGNFLPNTICCTSNAGKIGAKCVFVLLGAWHTSDSDSIFQLWAKFKNGTYYNFT
jgi:hypothetical protein